METIISDASGVIARRGVRRAAKPIGSMATAA